MVLNETLRDDITSTGHFTIYRTAHLQSFLLSGLETVEFEFLSRTFHKPETSAFDRSQWWRLTLTF